MNEIEVYLDLEFDKIHSTSGYVQGVIAFGACCRYLGEIKTFYSLVCPKGFKKLSKQVKESFLNNFRGYNRQICCQEKPLPQKNHIRCLDQG